MYQTILKWSSQSCRFSASNHHYINYQLPCFNSAQLLKKFLLLCLWKFKNCMPSQKALKIRYFEKMHCIWNLKLCDCVRVLRFFDGFEMLHILFTNFSRACQMLYWNWYNRIWSILNSITILLKLALQINWDLTADDIWIWSELMCTSIMINDWN